MSVSKVLFYLVTFFYVLLSLESISISSINDVTRCVPSTSLLQHWCLTSDLLLTLTASNAITLRLWLMSTPCSVNYQALSIGCSPVLNAGTPIQIRYKKDDHLQVDDTILVFTSDCVGLLAGASTRYDNGTISGTATAVEDNDASLDATPTVLFKGGDKTVALIRLSSDTACEIDSTSDTTTSTVLHRSQASDIVITTLKDAKRQYLFGAISCNYKRGTGPTQ